VLRDLATTIVHRRKLVLVLALAWFGLAGAVGGGVASHLTTGGFVDKSAESTKVNDLLKTRFHTGDPNVVLLVTARQGTVDSPDVAAAGQALTRRLAGEPTIAQAISYWSLGSPPPLKSKDGRQALVLARLSGTDDQASTQVKAITPRYTITTDPTIKVQVGGFAQVFHQVSTTIREDLARAELYSIVPTILLLLVIFGSAAASLLPLAIGGLAVVGTFFSLRVVASFTHVSIFSLNLTTAMGLGLGIDYALFIVSRYREELTRGLEPNAAVVRAVETAGRTVIFSAATVAISLAALLVFPLYFLKSFAYAGIAVVVLAALGAVVVLPAILAALGRRVEWGTLWRHRVAEPGQGAWHRMAMMVMRRPVLIGGAVVGVLLVLGSPFLKIHFGLPDDRVLPSSASSRVVQDALRTNFDARETAAVSVVAGTIDAGQIDHYAVTLSGLTGVGRVDALTGSYAGGRRLVPPGPANARFTAGPNVDETWLSVVPTVEPESPRAEALVKTIRHVAAPFPVQAGGQSAQLVDSKASLFSRLPLALGIIALVTFIVLFLFTGSVVVPVKALVLNVLSLAATFGAMVWIFQQGHLAHALNFTPTGTIDTTTPILMFCIAFGLSMDYEVFMLSRIKEEHDRTGDNVGSVAIGLERTGRIVTAIALVIAVVFIAFATSRITFIKLFGVGLAMAVLVDATLVRAALVPAFMRLAGDANWWAPGPLRRLHQRIGISEVEISVPVAATSDVEGRDAYRLKILHAADACTSDAELQQLLAEENLTAADLQAWRKDLSVGAGR
jgi:putative drug exporter of the RND superfamily